MNKLIILWYVVMICFSARVGATACIGYYTNPASVGILNQWGDQGDNFSLVDVKGYVSWPKGKGSSLFKSPVGGVPAGNWSTYSIALPKKVLVNNGGSLDVKVVGKMSFNTPLNQNYNAWLIHTVNEGCRGLNPGWNVVNDTNITGGNITIVLQGEGFPSGIYNVQIPYSLAWGTDPNQSEVERIKGTWAEINPSNRTGTFKVSFEVKNKCDISGQNVDFYYGTLTPDKINGNKKNKNLQLNCLSSAEVSLSLSPTIVDLKNGVIAKIKVKDMNDDEVKAININGGVAAVIKVESELEVVNAITEGGFSGSSVLSIKYK